MGGAATATPPLGHRELTMTASTHERTPLTAWPCRPRHASSGAIASRMLRVLAIAAASPPLRPALVATQDERLARDDGPLDSANPDRKHATSLATASLLENFGLARRSADGGITSAVVRGELTPRPRTDDIPLTHATGSTLFGAAHTATGFPSPSETPSRHGRVRETRRGARSSVPLGTGTLICSRATSIDPLEGVASLAHGTEAADAVAGADKEVGP